MYSHSCAVALRSPYLGLRFAATAAAVATRSRTYRLRVQAAATHGTAGEVIFHLNQLSLGRDDPRLQRVKSCIDKAVLETLGSHASVQHQGSTRKGTGLVGSSDWDFFVHLDNSVHFVTQKQRTAIVQQLGVLLQSAGVDYSMRCGDNRIFMWNGSGPQGYLPDVDVVFERFKTRDPEDARTRVPPNNRAFAHSPSAQQVVKYIKRLPVRFTQLPVPKSSRLEKLVLQLQQHHFEGYLSDTAEGFEALLEVVLEAIARASAGGAAENANADSSEWQGAAQFVINKQVGGCGWLIV